MNHSYLSDIERAAPLKKSEPFNIVTGNKTLVNFGHVYIHIYSLN